MAKAIRAALEMDPAEKRARMQRMREGVKERNVYRWAGDLISCLGQIRLSSIPPLGIRAPNGIARPDRLPSG